jgi:translation initiation factor 1 (eIF-1/SUI1)
MVDFFMPLSGLLQGVPVMEADSPEPQKKVPVELQTRRRVRAVIIVQGCKEVLVDYIKSNNADVIVLSPTLSLG